MLTVCSALLVTSLAFGAPPSPRSRAPLAPERIEEMLVAPTRHVRGLDRDALSTLERGARRSYTFARLLDTLERSDVIVYVETLATMPNSLAGRMLFAGSAHGQRYVRIQIAPAPDDDMAAVLGHELQHAIEIAEAPEVHDDTAMAALYKRIGQSSGDAWHFDTIAARETGRTVKGELAG